MFAIIATASAQAQSNKVIFTDDFTGSRVSGSAWYIPTWRGSNDGTFFGQTQVRCSQNATLPTCSNGQALIDIDSYNPTGFSFYGTDLISKQSFKPGSKGIILTVRAKVSSSIPGGFVAGIYFYGLKSGGAHDEIDFELVSNTPKKINTNIYKDEPLGVGDPTSADLSKPITDWHVYQIKWLPDEVIWLVDDQVIREEKTNVPKGPMPFNLNMWAPGSEWPLAYNSKIKATYDVSANKTYSLIVDYVKIEQIQ